MTTTLMHLVQDHSVVCEPGCWSKHIQLAISETSSRQTRLLHICTGDSTSDVALQTTSTSILTHSGHVTGTEKMLALKVAVHNWSL